MQSQIPLRYKGYTVSCQETPNEISLVINVCGCPHKCVGCHSLYLWENDGEDLVENLQSLLDIYDGLVTCICFMGGDWNEQEMIKLCFACEERGFKTCLYSGNDDIPSNELLTQLDYVKVGSYKQELGGLIFEQTNQRYYKVIHEMPLYLKDITFCFKKEI